MDSRVRRAPLDGPNLEMAPISHRHRRACVRFLTFRGPRTGQSCAGKRAGIRQMWGCGHPTATASGLLLPKAALSTTARRVSKWPGTT